MKLLTVSALLLAGSSLMIYSCKETPTKGEAGTELPASAADTAAFDVFAESFGDLQLLRYQVPGFTDLSLKQKQLAYYLYEAALCGRDIIYDQKHRHGLMIRKTIETIWNSYKGDKNSADWKAFETYSGRFWFSNGAYHHYSNEKFVPACSKEYFASLVKASDLSKLPMNTGENVETFLTRITPIIFDAKLEPKLVDLRPDIDNVAKSASNFYEGVTGKEVEAYYAKFSTQGNAPSWGLNSKVVKENGVVTEKIWKVGGMYTAAIEKIVGWLERPQP
jgi:dipeptidyl-peptidase-3